MNGLRWILLIAGVVLIVGIYFWGKRGRRAVTEMTTAPRDRPFSSVDVVPQLDEVIPGSKRVLGGTGPIRSAGEFDSDSLPPMHATDNVRSVQTLEPMQSKEDFREPRVSEFSATDWSATSADKTGAYKADPTLSESVLAAANFSQTGSQRVLKVTTPVSEVSPSTQQGETSAPSVDQPIPAPRARAKNVSKRKIIAMRLSAGAIRVDGARLKSLLEAAGLQHGKYSIYHRFHEDGQTSLFSVASMVEPGTFDPFAMSGQQFPGVTLFAQLPGAIDGMEIFSQMLSCARELERAIGGVLQDERGLPLTEQRVERLREDVADFLHLLGAP